MPNNISIKDAVGATVQVATALLDGSPFVYPSTGHAAAGVLFAGPDASTAPSPVTSANPLPVHLPTLAVDQGAATGSTRLVLVGGAVSTSPPSLTNGQVRPFSIDATGCARVRLPSDHAPLAVYLNSATLANGSTLQPRKFAFANLTTSGVTSLVSPVSGKRIVVLGYAISFNSTFSCYFQGASAQVSRAIYGIQYANASRSMVPAGCFSAGPGEGLSINCTGGTVSGSVEITYIEE